MRAYVSFVDRWPIRDRLERNALHQYTRRSIEISSLVHERSRRKRNAWPRFILQMIREVLELIRQQLNSHFLNIDRRDEDWVILSNVIDHEGHPFEDAKGKIVMFLTNISHETVVSTFNPAARTAGTNYVIVRPPLYIDLFILFFANFYDKKYAVGLKMISSVIEFFQQNPWFTHANMPDLDPSIDKFTMEITNLDLLQLNYLMSALGTKYLPSVYYKLRMIPFASGAMQAEVPAARGASTSQDPADAPVPKTFEGAPRANLAQSRAKRS